VGSAEKFSAEIADIPADKWVSWRRHRIEAGETLTSIGKKYRVTPAAISDANNLDRHAALDVGEKLIIPAAAPAESKSRLVRYRVRKGDTLGGIADRFSVPAEDVRKWNHMKTGHVSRGMVLRIYTIGGAPEIAPEHTRAKTSSKARASQPSAASPQPAAIHN
jgi:membrane-bound lytic murein transglycosylase D